LFVLKQRLGTIEPVGNRVAIQIANDAKKEGIDCVKEKIFSKKKKNLKFFFCFRFILLVILLMLGRA
jgi:hypothetical protein